MAGSGASEKKRGSMAAGVLAALSGAALWGLNAVASKFLMERGIDTMWMVNFRMITSGLCLLLFGAAREGRRIFGIWRDRRSVARLLVIAVFAFGICQLTYYLSISYSNAGIAAAIQQTAPVFVLLYVIVRDRRKPTAAELTAVPMVVAGSFLIATHGDPHALAVHPLALVFGLISALCCALYITMPAPLIKEHGTMQVVGWGLFLGGCFLAPFCRLWDFPDKWDAVSIAGMAFIILPGAAFAFALFLYGASITGPVRAGVYNLFEPAVAVLASAAFLGQAFHITELTGIAAILTGIAILTVSKGGKENSRPAEKNRNKPTENN